jgi:hypothetical protein
MHIMPDPSPMLEYAFHVRAEPVGEDWRTSAKRIVAFGYVAACVFGLILMGVIMALQV